MPEVNPCGPVFNPPDVETALDALKRRQAYHLEESRAIWLPKEYRKQEKEKAIDQYMAIYQTEWTN